MYLFYIGRSDLEACRPATAYGADSESSKSSFLVLMYIQSNCSVTTIHFFIDPTYIEATYLQFIYKFSFRSSIIGSQRRPNAAGKYESKRSVLAHSELRNKLVRYDLGPYIHTYTHTYIQAYRQLIILFYLGTKRSAEQEECRPSTSAAVDPPSSQESDPGKTSNATFSLPL